MNGTDPVSLFGKFASDFDAPTPLVRSRQIGPKAGMSNLWFKLETGHRTGSYKDRFAAAAIHSMMREGDHTCVATSSGNTGAALAAYCASAGIRCRVALVETAPREKLFQMQASGAELIRVREFGLDEEVTTATFRKLKELGKRPGHSLQISAYCFSPSGMRGVETLSNELANQLPGVNHIFAPAGGGGLALALARGYSRSPFAPAVHVVQPSGNATIAGPFREGKNKAEKVRCTSQISGLQVPSVLDGTDVIRECRSTGGIGHLVSDETIWEIQKRLAREEGIFAEPAGAVALAGALQAFAAGEVSADSSVTCLVTGSGFKDARAIDRMIGDSECTWADSPGDLN